jgi:hypothetical protein
MGKTEFQFQFQTGSFQLSALSVQPWNSATTPDG